MINQTVKYILTNHTSFIHIYVYTALRSRGINVVKIVDKLHSVYGVNYNAYQFLEFGELYLNEYLEKKHGLTFHQLLDESFKSIVHRFGHLVN